MVPRTNSERLLIVDAKFNPKGESDAKDTYFVGQISEVTELWLIIFWDKNRPFAPVPWYR